MDRFGDEFASSGISRFSRGEHTPLLEDEPSRGLYRTPVPTNVRCDLCMRRPASFYDEATKANYSKECLELLLSLEPPELRRQHKLSAPRKGGSHAFAPTETVGIGVQLERDFTDGSVRVKQLLPESPAALCGEISENDLLCQVDGTDVSSLSVEELASTIQGPVGSSVQLGLVRPGRIDGLFYVNLTRGASKNAQTAPYVPKKYDNISYFLSPEERAHAQAEAHALVERMRLEIFPPSAEPSRVSEPRVVQSYVRTEVRADSQPTYTTLNGHPGEGEAQALGFIASEETLRRTERPSTEYVNFQPTSHVRQHSSEVEEARVISQHVTRTLPVMRDDGPSRSVYSQNSENQPIGYERSMDSVDDPNREVLKA